LYQRDTKDPIAVYRTSVPSKMWTDQVLSA
jgi:hypothetical protein